MNVTKYWIFDISIRLLLLLSAIGALVCQVLNIVWLPYMLSVVFVSAYVVFLIDALKIDMYSWQYMINVVLMLLWIVNIALYS